MDTNVINFLTASTANVTENDMNRLKNEGGFLAGSYDNGCFIWVGGENPEIFDEYSVGFIALIGYARSKNIQYILLDSDARTIDELFTYDW